MAENNRIPFGTSRAWARQFPQDSGVYSVFEFGELIYVGESGSIQGRMRDLFDTRNHTLRRSLGSERFEGVTGYERATGSKKFPPHIEERLNEYMERSLAFTAIELTFGRREVEEHMVRKYKPSFNAKKRRGE